ncbi:MAG: hypothetical protein RR555_11290 [Bacteroidales bacterium]
MKSLTNLLLLIAVLMGGCSKEIVIPVNPADNTLKLNNTDLTLAYLQMHRLEVTESGVDTTQVQWSIKEGEEIVSLLDKNTVVGRRKGTATIVAKYADKVAIAKVTVNSETYIPVESLIFEINGKRVSSKDSLIWQDYELMKIKIVGYEPANASYAYIRDTDYWMRGQNGPIDKPFQNREYLNGTALAKMRGMADKIKDSLMYRIGWQYGTNYLSTDTIGYNYLKFTLKAFPDGLVRNEIDRAVKFKEEINLVIKERKNYINAGEFYYNDAGSGNGYDGDARKCVYIHTGESIQLPMERYAPADYNDVVWTIGGDLNEGNLEKVNKNNNRNPHYFRNNLGKLKITPQGMATVDTDYVPPYTYEINGKENGLLIGFATVFLMEDSLPKMQELRKQEQWNTYMRCRDKETIAIVWLPN